MRDAFARFAGSPRTPRETTPPPRKRRREEEEEAETTAPPTPLDEDQWTFPDENDNVPSWRAEAHAFLDALSPSVTLGSDLKAMLHSVARLPQTDPTPLETGLSQLGDQARRFLETHGDALRGEYPETIQQIQNWATATVRQVRF